MCVCAHACAGVNVSVDVGVRASLRSSVHMCMYEHVSICLPCPTNCDIKRGVQETSASQQIIRRWHDCSPYRYLHI